jgi:hypothetical protein
VPDGVILEHELAGQWGIRVERYRSCAIKLFVAERPNRSRSRRAVAPNQIQRGLFRYAVVLPERLDQLNLQGIHSRDEHARRLVPDVETHCARGERFFQ